MPRHRSISTLITLLATVTFSLAVAASVNADPITVSGSATIVNGQSFGPAATVNLTGQGFSANVTDSSGNFGNFGISPCSRSIGGLNGPCTGANLNFVSIGSDLQGTFTINGTSFSSGVLNQLSLSFASVSFVIPSELLDDAAVRITAPFTCTGSALPDGGQPLSLEGQGTVQLFLTRQTVNNFTGLFLDHADYIFGPTPAGVTINPCLSRRRLCCC